MNAICKERLRVGGDVCTQLASLTDTRATAFAKPAAKIFQIAVYRHPEVKSTNPQRNARAPLRRRRGRAASKEAGERRRLEMRDARGEERIGEQREHYKRDRRIIPTSTKQQLVRGMHLINLKRYLTLKYNQKMGTQSFASKLRVRQCMFNVAEVI